MYIGHLRLKSSRSQIISYILYSQDAFVKHYALEATKWIMLFVA